MGELAAEGVGWCGGEDDEPRSSERVTPTSGGHPDWELSALGAERRDGQVFIVVVSGEEQSEIRMFWRAQSECSAVVPRVVLEHVLRVQRDVRV